MSDNETPATESTVLAVAAKPTSRQITAVFNEQPLFDTAKLEHYQRIATGLMYSSMLPPSVQGPQNLSFDERSKVTFSNLILLLDIADRWKASIIAVTQTASIVYGKICFEGKMIQAVLESRLGVELVPEYTGEKGTPGYGIKLYDKARPERSIEGTIADWQTFDKNDRPLKQWVGNAQTLQLKYRGTREWCRSWEPGLLLGIYSDDELVDMAADRPAPVAPGATISGGFTKPRPQETQVEEVEAIQLIPGVVNRALEEGKITAEKARELFGMCNHEAVAQWRILEIQEGRGVPDMTEQETKTLMAVNKKARGVTEESEKAAAEAESTRLARVRAEQKAAEANKKAPGKAQEAVKDPPAPKAADKVEKPAEATAPAVEEEVLDDPQDEEIVDPVDAGEVSSFWRRGYEDAKAGRPNKPGKIDQVEALDYAMGFNQGAAELLNPDMTAPADEGDEEVLDDAPADDSVDYDALGFADGYAGKPRNPPRGLVGPQIDAYVGGHARGLDTLQREEEAADAAARDPFNVYAVAISGAQTWGAIKNALVVLNKTPAWVEDSKLPGSPKIKEARRAAWERVDALETAGGEFVDMTLDLTAFRCFVEYETNPEIISNQWEVLAGGALYSALPDDRKRGLESAIRERVRELTT